jgi:predicted nucleotidyltransferase
MQRIVTLTERKFREAARRRDAVAALVPVLAEYARAHGGRFLLLGSAARGTMKYHSDVDLLMDFPAETLNAAWKFADNSVLEP